MLLTKPSENCQGKKSVPSFIILKNDGQEKKISGLFIPNHITCSAQYSERMVVVPGRE
jgi:hypothetical protein